MPDHSPPADTDERPRASRRGLNVAFEEEAGAEISFGLVKRAVTTALGAPAATVSLIDARKTALGVSLCVSAVHGEEMLVVEDAAQDARFKNNPVVAGGPHVRFYAGVPLVTTGGTYIGSLCVIDDEPHAVDANARGVLADMAQLVVDQFELRQRAGGSPEAGNMPVTAGERREEGERRRAAKQEPEGSAGGHPAKPDPTKTPKATAGAPTNSPRTASSTAGESGDGRAETRRAKMSASEGKSPKAASSKAASSQDASGSPSVSISEAFSADAATASRTAGSETAVAQARSASDTKKDEARQGDAETDAAGESSFLNWKNVLEEELENVSFSFDPLEDLRKQLEEREPGEGEIALVGHLEMPGGETIHLPKEPLHRALDRVLRNADHDTLLVSVELTEGQTLLRISETDDGFSVDKV